MELTKPFYVHRPSWHALCPSTEGPYNIIDLVFALQHRWAFQIRAKPGLFTPGEKLCSATEPWHETLQPSNVLTGVICSYSLQKRLTVDRQNTETGIERKLWVCFSPFKPCVAYSGRREIVLPDLSWKKNLTWSWAKNPPSALAVIYEVLTSGPERINILLGKCFPLGCFPTTVCRCLGDTERESVFPLQSEWKSMSKKFFSAEFWQWSMTFYCLLTALPSLTSGMCFGCQRPLAAL